MMSEAEILRENVQSRGAGIKRRSLADLTYLIDNTTQHADLLDQASFRAISRGSILGEKKLYHIRGLVGRGYLGREIPAPALGYLMQSLSCESYALFPSIPPFVPSEEEGEKSKYHNIKGISVNRSIRNCLPRSRNIPSSGREQASTPTQLRHLSRCSRARVATCARGGGVLKLPKAASFLTAVILIQRF